MCDLLHSICTVIFLIAGVRVAFVFSVFVGGALVDVASTDDGTDSGTVAIALVAGDSSFLLSLAAVLLLGMIAVVANNSQREE